MNDTNHHESRLWRLLEKEQLADLAQFHRRGVCDEVPLYARVADIAFLPEGKDAASEILLRFALRFLNAVVAYQAHPTGYFAAITVWSLSAEPLVPYLFVCRGAVRGLKEKLALHGVTTPFGKHVQKLVQRLRVGEGFTVVEDTSTLPDAARIFLAPTRPPYQGFVALDTFCRPVSAAQ